MQAHIAYWSELLGKGNAIVFVRVGNPSGPWGLGIICASDDEHMRQITEDDPSTRSGLGFQHEVLPMIQAIVAG